MQHIRQPQPFKRRLHRWIKPRIDPRRALAVRLAPRIDLAQFSGKLLGHRGLFPGRVALAIADNHQPDRIGPSPEI